MYCIGKRHGSFDQEGRQARRGKAKLGGTIAITKTHREGRGTCCVSARAHHPQSESSPRPPDPISTPTTRPAPVHRVPCRGGRGSPPGPVPLSPCTRIGSCGTNLRPHCFLPLPLARTGNTQPGGDSIWRKQLNDAGTVSNPPTPPSPLPLPKAFGLHFLVECRPCSTRPPHRTARGGKDQLMEERICPTPLFLPALSHSRPAGQLG